MSMVRHPNPNPEINTDEYRLMLIGEADRLVVSSATCAMQISVKLTPEVKNWLLNKLKGADSDA